MLDANIKTQLKAYLERVTQPIEIVASLDDGPKSKELLELLHDVAEQSKLITLVERRDDDERKPSFSVGPRFCAASGRGVAARAHRFRLHGARVCGDS